MSWSSHFRQQNVKPCSSTAESDVCWWQAGQPGPIDIIQGKSWGPEAGSADLKPAASAPQVSKVSHTAVLAGAFGCASSQCSQHTGDLKVKSDVQAPAVALLHSLLSSAESLGADAGCAEHTRASEHASTWACCCSGAHASQPG